MRGTKTLGLALTGLMSAGAAQAATPDCAKLATLRLPAIVKITATERVAAAAPGTVRANPMAPPIAVALPAYCRVTGTINQRIGAGGKPYGLGFEIRMPADWNGRFLFQGGGGLNGTVNPPLGAQATGDRPALARGFAVVSTDSGHSSPAVFDASFMADQQAALDFALSSVPTVTGFAKLIVQAYYGTAPHHSYIVGCSTGGREAMMAVQRYPSLFDGAIAGAPAMRTGYSNIATSRLTVMLNQAAAKDAQGRVTALFSDGDKAAILKGMLAACDDLDGLSDGVIGKATACQFRPATIACKGAKGAKADGCLSGAQVAALEAAFQPTRDKAGALLYSAFPWDTGVVAGTRGIPGVLTTGTPSPLGPPNFDTSIDLDARAQVVRADATQALIDTAVWTNLSSFTAHGGKLILYHGVSDPWFSALDTLDWFDRAATANPGWDDQARLYMVPGMGHCQGGADTFDRFDLLTALIGWVEDGKAPASVPAGRDQPTPGSRPLCPFPAYPHYRGTGDVARAESFDCRKS